MAGVGETVERSEQDLIDEAVRLLETGLRDVTHRELVSTSEISDLLLDVRLLLEGAKVECARAAQNTGSDQATTY